MYLFSLIHRLDRFFMVHLPQPTSQSLNCPDVSTSHQGRMSKSFEGGVNLFFWKIYCRLLTIYQLTGDCGEVKTAGIYSRKKVLLMTHLPMSPIPKLLCRRTHLEIQGGRDDSFFFFLVGT